MGLGFARGLIKSIFKIVLTGLNEVIYHETLDNGLEVYIYKKEGFNKKTAYFTTNKR